MLRELGGSSPRETRGESLDMGVSASQNNNIQGKNMTTNPRRRHYIILRPSLLKDDYNIAPVKCCWKSELLVNKAIVSGVGFVPGQLLEGQFPTSRCFNDRQCLAGNS